MPDPVSFISSTARWALPYLFPAQIQREPTINEAHALTDALLHPSIHGLADTPPASPADGEAWLIAGSASGAWSGHTGKIAAWQAGTWLFIQPRNGMRVHDEGSGQEIRFAGEWQRASAVAIPSGGPTVDAEARAAIAGLIEALVAAGILPDA